MKRYTPLETLQNKLNAMTKRYNKVHSEKS